MIIGLTGGIGSGKSTVAKLFEIMDCSLFYSDECAREVYFDAEVRRKVTDLLGPRAYKKEFEPDRAYIGSKIFTDTALLHALNDIIHPEVRKRFSGFVKANPGKIIVKETALLFEAKIEKEVDKIVMVAADDELRISRVIARDGLTREDVLKKIKSQLPQDEKIRRSDFVIYNNEKEFLITQVMEVLNKIKTKG